MIGDKNEEKKQNNVLSQSNDSDEPYSGGGELETDGERQIRKEKARAEILTRIQKWKETKWQNKKPTIKLPSSKVKLFTEDKLKLSN